MVFTAEILWAIIKAHEEDQTSSLKEKKKYYKRFIQAGLPALTLIFVVLFFSVAIYFFQKPN